MNSSKPCQSISVPAACDVRRRITASCLMRDAVWHFDRYTTLVGPVTIGWVYAGARGKQGCTKHGADRIVIVSTSHGSTYNGRSLLLSPTARMVCSETLQPGVEARMK